jgi:hypothetical protein
MPIVEVKKSFFWISIFILLMGALGSVEKDLSFTSQSELYRYLEQKRLFEFDLDQDLNLFPDDWFVEQGPDFETYHKIELVKQGFKDSHSLSFGFSGGQTGVFSAPLVLEKRYAYNISLAYRSEGLDGSLKHRLRFGLRAYDKNNRLLNTFDLTQNSFSSDWVKSASLRIEMLPENTTSCVLFIHLAGRPAGASILMVDQVKVEASPRIRFITGQPLNTFNTDQDVSFQQWIEGTDVGKNYDHIVEIKDFMGNNIGAVEKKSLQGQLEAIKIDKKITPSLPGVYYVHTQLIENGQVMVDRNEIVAKDTSLEKNFSNTDFGVLIGRPSAPFEPMTHSMALLGTSVSKLDLFKDSFRLDQYSKQEGLEDLNPLLRKLAPDLGYHFIAVLNQVPQDTIIDKYRPPENVVTTFANRANIWNPVLDDLVLKYGNVFSDWQLGQDAQAINDEQLQNAQAVIQHIRKEMDWMKMVVPGSRTVKVEDGYLQNLNVAWDISDENLKTLLARPGQKALNVTLELGSNQNLNQLKIIEDLVRRITYIKAAKDASGKPLVGRLFIDRLSGQNRGLMTENYQPHSTYFAAKTLIYWMKGAEYIGKFQNPDHEVVNHVFIRGEQAFCILWRESLQGGQMVETKEATYYLGQDVRAMDLMGNAIDLIENGRKCRVAVGSTPLFLITPHRELWETMLSFLLQRSDVKARVQLQPQDVRFTNYFGKQAKFDVVINYPEDWEVLNPRFSKEVFSGAGAEHAFRLSPSPLFPLNLGVPVYVDIEASLADQHHLVKVYREDRIGSDVVLGVSFFKDPQGLKMDIRLNLSADVTKASTFLVSAQLPNGQIMETFFKAVQPGEKRQNSLFILDGQNLIGGDVVITARENIGQRYLNHRFPIQPVF